MLFLQCANSALAALPKLVKLRRGMQHEEDMLDAALGLSQLIDRANAFIGKSVSWLVLAAVLVSAVNAIIRKAFDTSSNAWLEAQWYLFGAVFMLAAAWVLQLNAHVRIDALSTHFSQKTRNWIDLFGHIFFLLPLCLLMIWLTIPYFWESFIGNEISANAGGLIVWPTKLFILIGFILLTFQGLSEIIKRLAVIKGVIADPHTGGVHG
jgi:TRAP-type mannitol/chloroaromatic compound transport system permease small subunit